MAAATTPDWIEAISASVTALGVLTAGAWALYNFGITRVRKPVVTLAVILRNVNRVGKVPEVHISVVAANTGRTGVHKKAAFLRISPVSVIRPDVAADVEEGDLLVIPLSSTFLGGQTRTVFGAHTYLEPGEVFSEDALVAVSGNTKWIHVEVQLVGRRDSESWLTSTVLHVTAPPAPSPLLDTAQ